MKTRLLGFVLGAIMLFGALPLVHAEIVGAHVTKVLTDYTEPGYASAAFLVCAGNTSLSYPEVLVSSESETKTVIIEGDVPENTCIGETAHIKANDLSSITAELITSSGPISIDVFTRDLDGLVMMEGMSIDGKIMIRTASTVPIAGEPSKMKIEFLDTFGNHVQHVNYNLMVKQNGINVLEESPAHTHIGVKYHETNKLNSNSSLDVEIELLGLGLPGENVSWEGPKGKIVQFQAMPEFGALTTFVLIATISSVIILGLKTRMNITQ